MDVWRAVNKPALKFDAQSCETILYIMTKELYIAIMMTLIVISCFSEIV